LSKRSKKKKVIHGKVYLNIFHFNVIKFEINIHFLDQIGDFTLRSLFRNFHTCLTSQISIKKTVIESVNVLINYSVIIEYYINTTTQFKG